VKMNIDDWGLRTFIILRCGSHDGNDEKQ